MSISSGLFVPSILIGAAWGRCVGLLLNKHVEFIEWGDVGKYALIGAVAQLAGVVRLSFSLTAIVMEATGINTIVTELPTITLSKYMFAPDRRFIRVFVNYTK